MEPKACGPEKRPGVTINRRDLFGVCLMILLYLDCDIAFPSPTLAKGGDGAAHGA